MKNVLSFLRAGAYVAGGILLGVGTVTVVKLLTNKES